MGAAIDAAGDVATPIRKRPVVLVGATVTGLLLLVGLVFSLVPLIGQFIHRLVIAPVALAGLVAMIDAAFADEVALGDLFDGMRTHGPSVIGGHLIIFGISIVVALVVVVAAFAFGVGVMAAFPSSPDAAGGGGVEGLGVITLLTVLVLFLVALVVVTVVYLLRAFIDVAVVIGGADATESVTESWRIIRDGPVSVVGYLLMRGVLTLVAALPTVLFVGLAVGFDTGAVAGGQLRTASPVFAVLAVVALVVPFVVSVSYHVAYYRQRRDPVESTEPADERVRPERRRRDPQRTAGADDTGFESE